jgi:hypothetical protein
VATVSAFLKLKGHARITKGEQWKAFPEHPVLP